MMRLSRFKYGILLLLILALLVPTLSFADEEGDEDDTALEEYLCNDLVLGILSEMGRPDDCDYFLSLDVGPGQFKQAWRMLNMINPAADSATYEAAKADLLAYKADGFGWGQVKHAIYYSTDEVPVETILNDWRAGDNAVGWGLIKKAKELSESDAYEGTFEDALNYLGETELGWGLKKEMGYSGPPPWAKGGGNGAGAGDKFIPKEDDGDSVDGEDNGPPHGKAKGHGKNKDKGK